MKKKTLFGGFSVPLPPVLQQYNGYLKITTRKVTIHTAIRRLQIYVASVIFFFYPFTAFISMEACRRPKTEDLFRVAVQNRFFLKIQQKQTKM